MAFCNHCGAHLDGDEHFCGKCGNDVSAKTETAPAPLPPVPSAPAPQVQPTPPPTAQYFAPAQTPVAVPQQPPAKRGGMLGVAVVLVLLAAGAYLYTKHQQATPGTPATTPPSTTPAPGAPPAAGSTPEPETHAELLKQQLFADNWAVFNGFIVISNGKWTNTAPVAIQTATLECNQYAVNGALLDQMQTTLNGPVQPGAFATFNPFQMGEVARELNHVTCMVVHVKPVAATQ